jgi:hypothetical protein
MYGHRTHPSAVSSTLRLRPEGSSGPNGRRTQKEFLKKQKAFLLNRFFFRENLCHSVAKGQLTAENIEFMSCGFEEFRG